MIYFDSMRKMSYYLLFVLAMIIMAYCSSCSMKTSNNSYNQTKYKYAVIRYDIDNVVTWSAYKVGATTPQDFRPLYCGKMREITTFDMDFISDLESCIDKRYFKLTGSDYVDTWMMVMLYRSESEIIDTVAVSDEYGWYNSDVFRDTKLLQIVGDKIFEHDTQWKNAVIAEGFYVDDRWRTSSEVFWEILTHPDN